MATFTKVYAFSEGLCEKEHNLGSDALTIFLTTNANAPTTATDALSGVTQIAYTNLSSRVLSQSASAQSSGTYKLTISDLVLTASGGSVATFRRVGIYNDTNTTDDVICHFDYGSDLTLANTETLTLDFDGTNGLMTLA